MKKKICLVAMFMGVVIMSVGCGKSNEQEKTETYLGDSVKKIIVKAEANNITFSASDTNEIIVKSKQGEEESIGVLQGDTLTITPAESKPGIHIEGPSPVHIEVPKEVLEEVEVQAQFGNIEMSNIDVVNLRLSSKDGKITIKNMSGNIEAKTAMGKIEASDSQLNSQIEKSEDQIGQSLRGKLGEEENKNITITTDTGDILIQ